MLPLNCTPDTALFPSGIDLKASHNWFAFSNDKEYICEILRNIFSHKRDHIYLQFTTGSSTKIEVLKYFRKTTHRAFVLGLAINVTIAGINSLERERAELDFKIISLSKVSQ